MTHVSVRSVALFHFVVLNAGAWITYRGRTDKQFALDWLRGRAAACPSGLGNVNAMAPSLWNYAAKEPGICFNRLSRRR